LAFNNVHSPAAQTITSVPASLTNSSIQSLSVNSLPNNIVNLLKLANFETTWISMQGLTFGRFESFTSAIASYADKTVDISGEYDGSSIDLINNIISTNGNQAVFVHLMGSHPSFENRYPEKYQNSKLGLTENQHYDNSITYTDQVLSQIVDNSKNHNSIMVYFSDHGLLYNKETQHLQHASINTTQDIYNIPFFVWMSESFRRQNTTNVSTKNLHSRFNNEDLYFTVRDIMKISDNDSSEANCLSLLSECYKENDNDMVMDLSGQLYNYTNLLEKK
jgi:heptose-I-phosphate ethanolaminephosphotransferase